MSPEQIRARTIAIARGEYKPKPGEPKIWFGPDLDLAAFQRLHSRPLLGAVGPRVHSANLNGVTVRMRGVLLPVSARFAPAAAQAAVHGHQRRGRTNLCLHQLVALRQQLALGVEHGQEVGHAGLVAHA